MPIRLTGLNSNLDTDSIVKELVSAYSTKKDKYVKAQIKLSWTQDAWKDMNSKIYDFYSKTLSDMRRTSNYTNKKTTAVSDSTKATVNAASNVANGTQTLEVKELATAGNLTGAKVTASSQLTNDSKMAELGLGGEKVKIKVNGEIKEVKMTANMTISEFTSALSEQGVKANFDKGTQRFFVDSKASGKDGDFNFVVEDEASLTTMSKLGLATEADYKAVKGPAFDTSSLEAQNKLATKSDGSNAVIKLNGATFEGSSNSFSINGLSITATGVSNGVMTITTSTDVDGMYDMVKKFIKGYNELVNSMESAYNATNAKGYEPLTDAEKSEMSDKEVEQWEKKIKDSILRRDETLNTVLNSMTTAMSKTYKIDGKVYGLSSFGIKTAGYFDAAENETNAFHINGDPDEPTTTSADNKLKNAIASDPDTVMSFFTQLATDVYDGLYEKMGSTELSSIYKVYNDKQMKKEYDEYTETIKKWEQKVKDMEDAYYKKFSVMETALAKLQSQTNSLTSLMGG